MYFKQHFNSLDSFYYFFFNCKYYLIVFLFNDIVYTSFLSSASCPQLLFILRLRVKRDYPPATRHDDTLAVLIHA